jgi:transposase
MNQLKVNQRETIVTLARRGWSARRIARELGCDRDTASKYIALERAAKPATPSPGSGEQGESKPATPSTGAETEPERAVTAAIEAVRANVSLCAYWRKEIEAGLEQGLSAKRIHEDLVRDYGFSGQYQSVKRFVRRLERQAPVPFRRMEFAAGEQMQVDFGTGPWIVGEDGKRRRSHVFRAVL